jgi:hypothetical protein
LCAAGCASRCARNGHGKQENAGLLGIRAMISLRLTREVLTPECCRGVLEVMDAAGEVSLRLFTIEKPWIPNSSGGKAGEPFRSCIGPGTYTLKPFERPNGDKVWRLSNPDLDVFELDTDIPPARKGKGRFLILIHVANRARDVVGCIGPGRGRHTEADGTLMVTSSKDAMKDLHRVLDGKRPLQIEIVAPELETVIEEGAEAMARKKKAAAEAEAVYEWRENNACVATYNVLEGDQFLDQFEDVDIPFADAPDVKMKELRYFPQTTGNANILELLGIEMSRDFLRHVSKTFTLNKQNPEESSVVIIRKLAAIFSKGDRTIRDLAEVLDDCIRFPDEN